MAHQTNSADFKGFSIGLTALLMGLAIVWMLPAPDAAKGLSSYVPLHSVMEIIAIAVAAMVFGISWATHPFRANGRALVLGIGFLGVALLDLSHTLSYAGMPDLITPSGPEKAINFWLAARLLAGLAFIWIAFWPSHLANWVGETSRYWALAIILLLVAIVHYIVIVHPSSIPRTYIEGQGLTPFKVGVEYVLIALYITAGFGFIKRWHKKREISDSLLAMASFTMAMSEFFFTLYANVTDIYNVAGHIYKIIAFAFLYRALFIETIKHPYQSLQQSEEKISFDNKLKTMLLELQEREDLEKENDYLQRSLAYAKSMTDSSIAFLYTVENEKNSVRLLAFSDNTRNLAEIDAEKDLLPLEDAGAWADGVRQAKPILLNEITDSQTCIGLKQTQGVVERILTVPVLEGNQVKIILGVANKAEHFVEQDSKALQVIATTLWSMLKQGRKDAVINQLTEALEQSPHSIVMTDTSARIQYVNKAFSEASGYNAEEAIGQNPKILQSGETSPVLYEALWKRLTAGESWQGEFINKKKNGQTFIELVSVYPIKDRFGKLTNYVAHKIDVTQHKAAEKRIRDLSEFDALTGLLNRKSFQERLNTALDQTAEKNGLLSLLWFNLDNFKTINESLGHSAGDELLVEMANRIVHGLGTDATIARHGGDTFVAILPIEKQSLVALKAREVLNQIQAPFFIDGQPLSLSASVGIALYPEDAKTSDHLASAAEIAMYRAKQDGRNSLRFFSPDMQEHTQRSLDLAVSLKGAQNRGELFLVYQPQRRLSDSQTIGAEVLLRWRHPKWGDVSPAEFIPIAEQTGLIVDIGLWVLEQAARQLHQWDLLGLPKIFIAVNVSTIQFARPGFVEELMKVMSRVGVPTNRIEIEITEAVALKNAEQAGTIIQRLHAAGFAVALDDFGTGYSSLSYLKRYAIDRLKIDQSFVKDLVTNQNDQAIVNAIIHMAHSLQMTTIAEGVETEEQANRLKELGCDEIQGYWFSRPLVSQDFAVHLRG
ncbi:EAL domain-containing protein [Zwartia panacis]|uniref:EAL domain-containing protein n=1 Tax=Zwartia panacis TaxID=2683345 RepID=UPI0025B2A96D|nr:EAL domain-containing protein [Zwartia panacis]MDN4017882.1 EAL domain-containing protein [Zwartia panacis]